MARAVLLPRCGSPEQQHPDVGVAEALDQVVAVEQCFEQLLGLRTCRIEGGVTSPTNDFARR